MTTGTKSRLISSPTRATPPIFNEASTLLPKAWTLPQLSLSIFFMAPWSKAR